ncbi:dienelactone hydrolase family protein [Trichococcus pasteurii]|uniref:Alpha/beta hydrolase fold-5 n=1 Tax=Trichococcus pasteurii TaxID=43064 RepID=A0A1W1IF26_9LACT|nr:dienelactone hydrolase family protein [Trichococcus pasteurii]SFF11437.1 Alpha/beta hydrolase family protein [Trichococcus pasteurii]SLM51606.1 alpha/beta hydrolase fold-5 [Trichococcus pasteurii]SSB92487.1 alpha/beta hydrolase fold-5 [Trichococcus pasteurii]
MSDPEKAVQITDVGVTLNGDLVLHRDAKGLVIFAHGSGSSRHSVRNKYVASVLRAHGLATLLLDLLTEDESEWTDKRFDIDLLAQRLTLAENWVKQQEETKQLPIGYFGSSTGAAAALQSAAVLGDGIKAVVSRGGRPDLAKAYLAKVTAPTLLLVGGYDDGVIELNEQAYALLNCEKEMTIIPGATHLFEEAGTLEQVAELAAQWFVKQFPGK